MYTYIIFCFLISGECFPPWGDPLDQITRINAKDTERELFEEFELGSITEFTETEPSPYVILEKTDTKLYVKPTSEYEKFEENTISTTDTTKHRIEVAVVFKCGTETSATHVNALLLFNNF